MTKRLGVKGLIILMLAFLMWVPGVASNAGSVNEIFVGDPPEFKSVAAVISRSTQGTARRAMFNRGSQSTGLFGAFSMMGDILAMHRSVRPLTMADLIVLLRSGNQEASIVDVQTLAFLLSQGALSTDGIMNTDALEILSKILCGESDSGIMQDQVQDHDIKTEATFTGKHRSQFSVVGMQSIPALGQLHLRHSWGDHTQLS